MTSLSLPHEVAARYLAEDVPLIRAWREYLCISQQELANRLSVSQFQIAQWERPEAQPQPPMLKTIAAALGIHVRQLSLQE